MTVKRKLEGFHLEFTIGTLDIILDRVHPLHNSSIEPVRSDRGQPVWCGKQFDTLFAIFLIIIYLLSMTQ